MILLLYAHPYPAHSRACRALLDAATAVEGVKVHSLYDRYPDFDIPVAEEQALLRSVDHIVALHPVYWYAAPALLKHWMEKVLVRGFAYGPGGDALAGKHFLWAPTAGGDDTAYSEAGLHEHPFTHFMGPMEQTARYCRMNWEPPFVVQGAHVLSNEALSARAHAFAAFLAQWGGTDSHAR